MKITKRQLKRIIREEYSQLKRRGLIRENVPQPLDPDLEYEMAEELAVEMEEHWMDGIYGTPDMRKEEYINVGPNAVEALVGDLMDKYNLWDQEESTTSDNMDRVRQKATEMFLAS